MSTDIPFGAHPPTGGAGAPPTTISGVMQASSYFGAPSGNSPTDANPFHFVGSTAGASPSMVAQPPPPMQPPSSSMVAPATGPPSTSDFFAPSNPNVNIFNPGPGGGGGTTFESQMYPHQVQPTFLPGDSFNVSSATAPPSQPSQTQISTNPFPPTTSGVTFQSSGGSGADFFNAAPPQKHSEVAPPPPPTQGFTAGGQTTATESDAETRQPSSFQRHSSAPTLPGASTLFGGAVPHNPNNQLDSTGTNFFTSFSSQQQPSSLQESSSQGESITHFRDGRQQERPYSQEPPSPHRPSQPVAAFGGSGSLSAPSTTLHQVLPDHSDQQLQLHQAASELHHQSESSGSPVLHFRPPSNADIHVQGVSPPGADYQQMTNADCADSSSQLALNSSGMVPNQVHPGQVHPSLTEDLGMTNASHGSMAHLRTNASTDADLTAAIEDASTPDEATGPVQWSTSGQFLSNAESSGSGSRERDSSLNLDSKSVSSLLEGSQDDFSRYSPIRLLPPAPLGSEQSQSPQKLSTLQQQLYPSSSGVTLLPAAPQTGHKLEPSESREQLQFAVEHGHEKKVSDDLKDWEIVDSVPPASEVSQLPSSVRLLPPSSFVAISSQPVPTATVSSGGGGTTEVGGVSQAMMQKLSLEPSSRSQDSMQSHPPPSQGQGSHPSDASTGVMSTGLSLPHPVTSSETASSVAPLNTNFTNLERPPTTNILQSRPPTTSVGYHHHPTSGHSESHLSSNLPEPKEISSLITQIPFLTPVTSTTSLFTSQPALLTPQQPPPACSGANTAAPLSLHTVSSTTTTASAVTLVPPLSSLQTGDHQEQQRRQQLPFSTDSGVRGGEVVTTAATPGLSQRELQTEGGVLPSQFQQVQAPPVSAPVQQSDGTPLSRPSSQPPHHTAGSQQIVHVGTESSSMSAQLNLPAHTLPVAVTSAFEALSTIATGQLPGTPSITAVPGNPQTTAALQPSRPELAQPPPPSSLPHTTSAFVQVQQQQQQHGLNVVGASSQLPGRPDSNVQPPLQSPPAVTQSPPGISSTGPPPPIPTHAPTVHPEAGAPVVAAAAMTTSSAAAQQHHNPPPPPFHTTAAPVSQPPPPQPSSEPHQQPQSTDESQKLTEPQPPPPSQSQVTTSVPTTATYASSVYQEERHEQGGPPHAPPHHPHHPPDDHGYYHDSYYHHDREREPYYGGDPRDTRYRAPSAFSEREADHHYRHGYHHPRPDDGRARYDYSHYPDHPHDAGYSRYGGPNYGYDDHYPGGGGYPPPILHGPPTPRHGYRDEYGMPPPSRTPYYDPYDPYGYHHPHAHHHQRPYDLRYGEHYPPPPGSRGHPSYGSEYPPDPLYDPYHQPSAAYEHDPHLQQQPSESGYDSHTSYPPPHAQQTQPSSSYNPREELNPAEASAIGGQTNNFELSQFVDSPNTCLPSRSHPTQETQHNSTAYSDPQQQQQQYPETDQYAGEQHGYHHPEHLYGQGVSDPWYDHTYPPEAYAHESHHYPGHEGSYIAQPFYGQHEHLDGGAPMEEAPPIETTPPPPPRDTPELFAHPHVRATFGFGGQLVTVLPNYPASDSSSAIVEITFIKDVVGDDETRSLLEAVDASPGPFIPGDTPKSHVVRFASKEAQKCQEKILEVSTDREASRKLEDEALLWNFLVLLCQQNGVVVNSDISDLLMQDSPPAAAKPVPQVGVNTTQEELLESLRQLLFAGRKKDAVDMACSRGLWGHALMLASRMDEQTRTYVVNRFTASLMNTDPLNTFYTLLLGRTPSAVKPEGLPRAGDWKPHLAMILANRMSKLENASIVSLGDSLLSQKRLHAAHLCYHLASVHFGAYGNMDSKYSLLGINHSHLIVGSFPVPSDLHMMEVLEFAMSLSKQDFLMPHFQLFKFLHVLKLLELGFVSKALKYCEQISCSAVVKNPHCFAPVFLHLLVETSVRLHHLNSPFDLVENEFPTWLHQLQQLVSDALSTDYAPSLFSPSPAFSSVSQSYANQQQHQFTQPIIGLQANAPASTGMGGFLNVPGATGGSRVESGASSKEGSVINMKIDVTTAHLAMEGAPGNNVANEINVQSQEAIQSQQEQQQGGLMQQPPVQSYDPSQFQAGYDPNLASSMASQQAPSSGGELQTQPPQFQAGTSDTGYGGGQFGASSELHTAAGQLSYTSVASSNPPPPSGDYNIAQAQVQQGGQPYYGMAVQSHAQQPDQVTMMTQVPAAGHQQQEEEEPVEGNAASAGRGETGAQMGYDNYYGLASTSQPQVDHPTQQQPGGYSPPQPTVYDYSQWQPGTQHSTGGTVEEEQHGQQESSTRKEGVEFIGSGDSHVTEKKAGEENESREKDENKKGGGKSGKGDQQQRQGKAGSGWGFNLIKYILPKKKNEAHLPDDKKPSIIWDEEKKQWIDLTADEEDQSGPPPPPTDSELSKPPGGGGGGSAMPPSVPSMTSSGPTPSSSSSVAGARPSGGMESTDQGPARNTYSMQRSRRGLRSKYVDVLNPGGTTTSSSGSTGGPPPPPGPPLMGAMMPGPPQPFSGNFFVPQQPPVEGNQDSSNTGSTGHHGSQPAAALASETTTDQSTAALVITSSNDLTSASAHSATGAQIHVAQPAVTSSQGEFPQQNDIGGALNQGHSNHHPVDSHRVAAGSVAVGDQAPGNPLPQFFNPGAFAPVNTLPQAPPTGTNPQEPQDDAMSSVSLISESSQEVSQYMNRQVPPTTSAGYSRLKRGIRGVKPLQYPSSQQRPHPGHAPRTEQSGPPPVGAVRNSFQPRQPW